jgi:hypothetical protein
MKRLRIIFLILFIGQFALSQEAGKFSFDILLGPQVSYEKVTLPNPIEPGDITVTDYPRLSFSGGLVGYYEISNKIDIGLGIKYSGRGFGNTHDFSDTLVSITSLPNRTESIFRHHYIDIPVLLVYYFKKWNRLQLSIQSGFELNHLFRMSAIHYDYYKDGPTEKRMSLADVSGQRRFNLSIRMGLGLSFNVTERINIGFIPMFDYSLLNQSINFPSIKVHYWNIGGMLEIKHRF